jgi:hypothetical protein
MTKSYGTLLVVGVIVLLTSEYSIRYLMKLNYVSYVITNKGLNFLQKDFYQN